MSNAGQVPPKRGRGRPRKHPLPDPPLPRPVLYPPASDLVRSQRQRPSRSRQEPAPVPVLNPSRSRSSSRRPGTGPTWRPPQIIRRAWDTGNPIYVTNKTEDLEIGLVDLEAEEQEFKVEPDLEIIEVEPEDLSCSEVDIIQEVGPVYFAPEEPQNLEEESHAFEVDPLLLGVEGLEVVHVKTEPGGFDLSCSSPPATQLRVLSEAPAKPRKRGLESTSSTRLFQAGCKKLNMTETYVDDNLFCQNKAPSVNQSQPRVRQKNFSRQSADQPRPLVVQDPGPSCSFQLYEPTCSYQTAGMQSRPSAGLYEPSWSYQTAGMQSRPRAKPEVPPSCSYQTAGMQSRPLAKPEVPSSCSYQTVGMQSRPRAKPEVPSSCSYQTAGMQSRPCAEPEVPPSSFQTAGLLSRPLAEPEVPPSAPPDSKANIFSSSLPRVSLENISYSKSYGKDVLKLWRALVHYDRHTLRTCEYLKPEGGGKSRYCLICGAKSDWTLDMLNHIKENHLK